MDNAIRVAREQLGADNYRMRVQALATLGQYEDRASAPRAVELLPDEDYRVRVAALEMLGALGYRDALPQVVAMLQDKEMPVRGAAATALGGMGDQRAIEPLIASLGDRNDDVQIAAITSLVTLGGADVREPLIGCLRKGNSRRICYELVNLFADYPFPDVVEALIGALIHDDDDVRAYAAISLGIICDSQALPALEYMAANDGGEYWSEEENSWTETRSAAEGAIETIHAIEAGEEVERSRLAVQSRTRVRYRMKDYTECRKTFVHYGRHVDANDDVFPGPDEPKGLVDRIELRFSSRKKPYRPQLGTITVEWYAHLRARGVEEDAVPEMRIPWEAWGALAECGDLLTRLGHTRGPAMQPGEFAELLRQYGFEDITR